MEPTPIEHHPGRLAVAFRALSHRNYRLFFFGQSISVLGTWMQQIAMTWLVFYLTKSAFMLGVVAFTANLPLLLLGPFAGVWADRWDRRRTLLLTQSTLMLQAFLLATLALTGVIEVWHILVLSACEGFVTSADAATRSAFLPEIVEKKGDLPSAIALSSFVQYGARMLGPPLAGGLIAVLAEDGGVVRGTGWCFLVNGASYLAVCAALWAMRVAPVSAASASPGPILRSLQEGVAYSYRNPPVRDLILVQGMISLFGVPYALMPVVAADLLQGGPNTLGLLMGAVGFGSVAGAVLLASRQGIRGMIGRIGRAGLVLGLAIVAFSLSREVWLSVGFCAVIGFSTMAASVSGFTLLQTIVADDKRGRAVSLYLLAAWAMTPLGSLLMGSLSEWIGLGPTLLMSGACCLAGFLWFATQLPTLRPLIEAAGDAEEALPDLRRPLITLGPHHH